jgi:glycosyltransferase involved in cell wall biosynthesis
MSPTLTPMPEGREAAAAADAPRAASPSGAVAHRRRTIAQVVRSLEVGGGELLAATIAERLDRERFRSVVFCLQQPGWLARDLEERGVRVVRFGAGEGAKPGLAARVWRALRRERVDVVHCHNTMPLLYGGLAAAAQPLRRPALVMTKHGRTFWRGWRQGALARWLIRRAAVVAVSRDIERLLVDGGWAAARQVRTILNGVDLERFQPGCGRAAARGELGWTGDEFVAGVVARLVPDKDHATLLAAFAQLRATLPRARLAVIGDGPLRGALAQQAAALRLGDSCRFLGERRDVAALLPGFDVFVLASVTEGTPLTLLEAMAAGLPAVVTAVGGMPDVVSPGESGLLVPAADAGGLATALARVAADGDLRRQMGAAGRDQVVERFSLAAMVRKHEQLYEELCG